MDVGQSLGEEPGHASGQEPGLENRKPRAEVTQARAPTGGRRMKTSTPSQSAEGTPQSTRLVLLVPQLRKLRPQRERARLRPQWSEASRKLPECRVCCAEGWGQRLHQAARPYQLWGPGQPALPPWALVSSSVKWDRNDRISSSGEHSMSSLHRNLP